MAQFIGNTEINFIQGDDFERKLEFTSETANLILSITFSCNALKVCKELLQQGNFFALKLTSAETSLYRPMHTSYDMTVKFKSGEVLSQTAINLVIAEKMNKCW